MVLFHIHTSYSLLHSNLEVKKLIKRAKELGYKTLGICDLYNLFGAIEFYKIAQKEGIKPVIGTEVLVSREGAKYPHRLLLFAQNSAGYKNLLYLSSISYLNYFQPVEQPDFSKEHSSKNGNGNNSNNSALSNHILKGERSDSKSTLSPIALSQSPFSSTPLPQIPLSEIETNQEGLIVVLPMLESEIGFHLNLWEEINVKQGAKGFNYARQVAKDYRKRFKNLYLEIRRDREIEKLIEPSLIQIGKEIKIPILAQSSVYYLEQREVVYKDALECIAQNLQFDDIHRDIEFGNQYLRPPEEFIQLFEDLPEAVEATDRLAEEIDLKLELDSPTPPHFKFTKEYAQQEGLDIEEDVDYFVHKCWEGLEERLKEIPPEQHSAYRKRLEYEIEIIKKMKFPGYMLIVWDFINYAKDPSRHLPQFRKKYRNKPIPVGPGRGSAAGSLVAYALKITNIDPIKYGLLFERFLNPERVTLPDIDIDFCQERRGEVLEYVKQKYGELNVAQVITFQSLLARGVLRDVARIMGIPYGQADSFAKLVPSKAKNLKEALKMEPKISKILQQDSHYKRLYHFGEELEGSRRGTGTHAAGIVISDVPIWEKSPVYKADPSDPLMTTQYSLEYLESVDLIKFDFLGLKTLTIIQKTLDWIKKTTGKELDLDRLSVDDPEVYKLISSGKTLGLFQVESDGMQTLARRLQPTTFDDVIAMLALYRPGPMDAGMLEDYIERKHGRKPVSYFFKEFEKVLKPILEPTYGVIVYQEQVMQIVQTIGGFSLGEADIIRRAMGKKKKELIKKYGEEFSKRAEKRGYSYKNARTLYDAIEKFAGYGFNKSHSAAYALITYQTAYLKKYYPIHFFASLLSFETNNTNKIALYIEEAKSLGIKTLPPDIQLSGGDFTPTEKGILFGLNAIKGVGEKAVENIVSTRPFSNLEDFLERIDIGKVNRKVLEQLIKSGAMDSFGYTRQTLFKNIDRMLEYRRQIDEYNNSLSQSGSLFADFGENRNRKPEELKLKLVEYSEWETYQLLENEYSTLGFYVSGNPMDPFIEQLEGVHYNRSSELKKLADGEGVFIGKVQKVKRKISKKGTPYLMITLVDFHGKMEIFIFSELVEIFEKLDLSKPIVVEAIVNSTGEEEKYRLIGRKIMGLEEYKKKGNGKKSRNKWQKKEKKREREQVEQKEKWGEEEIILSYQIGKNFRDELATIVHQLEKWQSQNPGTYPVKLILETPFGYRLYISTPYRLNPTDKL